MSTLPPLRVAVLGAGTVGGAVLRGILARPDALASDDGAPVVLAGVADLDPDRVVRLGVPADLVTDAPARLVASPEVDAIVELIGGDEPARTLVAAALGAGKPVVTANKHLVAHHGPDLEAIARRSGAAFRFEAAVGGGVPVLRPLAEDLAVDRVRRVRGIVNGTTNVILTAMGEQGRPYAEILAEAQAAGFAEADPRGDVEGDDAVNKAVILARLAFGAWLDPAGVLRTPPTVRGHGRPGITGVTSAEVAAARGLGLAIKLLAVAEPGPLPGSVAVHVLPTAVPRDSALGATAGVLNRVEIAGEPVGAVAFSGPGAGGDATSSAVLADIRAIARGAGSTWAGLPAARSAPSPEGADGPLGGARAWFAFVPGAGAGGLELGPGAAVGEPEGGLAIRTGPLTLAAVRAAILPVLPAGLDATLYPVAE